MTASTSNLAIIGAQWGDEGKGKIVDLLCTDYDLVCRFQGGHNAGHTVKFADRHYSLHLIPSGILHPDKLCILGNGMVIDPQALLDEMEKLRAAGVSIEENLRISESAQVILPVHREIDLAREEAAGKAKIGTTGRGIGPAYESKISRYGILMGDLLHEATLRERVSGLLREKNALLTSVYSRDAVDEEAIVARYLEFGEILRDRITDTTRLVNDAIRDGRRIMFEGAQGSLLDVDHGTYPFVTSSNCVVGGICTGLGVAPKHVGVVLAVAKAYSTRVGSGPFPTELHDETGNRIRERGNEFGTTTGRPRRIGWLDLVLLRTSRMLNGIDSWALTKLDVLDELDEIPVCTGYTVDGTLHRTLPRFAVARGTVEPVYRTFPGWRQSTVGAGSFDDLPQNARDYIEFLQDETECPVSIVSTGPRREETIIR